MGFYDLSVLWLEKADTAEGDIYFQRFLLAHLYASEASVCDGSKAVKFVEQGHDDLTQAHTGMAGIQFRVLDVTQFPPVELVDRNWDYQFPEDRLGIGDLIRFKSLVPEMAKFLARAVRIRKNIMISGGTGSGKTTLLNVLSSFIGPRERVVTIEGAAAKELAGAAREHPEHTLEVSMGDTLLHRGPIGVAERAPTFTSLRPDFESAKRDVELLRGNLYEGPCGVVAVDEG